MIDKENEMTRIELMKSMIALNEKLVGRKLGFFEKVYGVMVSNLNCTGL